ncbi:MAG: arginine--tRNA ligase [Acidilobus sp.]
MDPLTRAIEASSRTLADLLKIDESLAFWSLMEPTKEEYGDAAFPAIRYTKDVSSLMIKLRETLQERYGINYVSLRELNGFLNIYFEGPDLARAVIGWLREKGSMEVPTVAKPLTIVVEHTSANPIHPLHIGHTRNACIGDSLARLLSARGHKVVRRFYIDDMGRQVAIAALGFKLLNVRPNDLVKGLKVKPDKLVGWVYAVTSTTIDAIKARTSGDLEEAEKLASALARLKSQDPGNLFDRLYNSVLALKDPEAEVSSINIRYEQGLEPERSLIRELVGLVLEGFRQSLSRIGVSFDEWDWESDLVWNGMVRGLVEQAKRSAFYIKYKDADAIDVPSIVSKVLGSDPEASSAIKVPKGLEIPPLILLRSDGSTLYTTRDLAYTLLKYRSSSADKVINVIGADQRLPQLQLRIALLGLGYRKEAINTIHYDYEIVRLPTGAMHGRRGEYVTLDEVLDYAKSRALEEVRSRNPDAEGEWAEKTAEAIAVGALRYSMVQARASKPLTFNVEKALNLKESSGPYLQYTYVRANNILEKHGPIDLEGTGPEALTGQRRKLMVKALRTPLVIAKAADDLAPEDLVGHLVGLADDFNAWYEVDTVIHEPDRPVRELKAVITYIVKEALGLGMSVLGIPLLRRM